MEIKSLLKEKLGSKLKFKEPMRKHTTIKIGGPAEYFYHTPDSNELIAAVKFAHEKEIPYLVIGEGSNILVSDAGFEGLIIKNETAKLVFGQNSAFAESGILLLNLIRRLAESNLGGLEFLSGIPGTLGGGIYGNAGAYGKCLADVVESVTILDSDGEIKQIDNKDFGFKYRQSILKSRASLSSNNFKRPVILSARIKIKSQSREGVLRVVDNYLRMRSKKIPLESSAGCVFKNIETAHHQVDPSMQMVAIEGKIPAALLIDKAGAKKERCGKLIISPKHTNFIINRGGGKARDFVALVKNVQQKIKEKFNLELEEEIEFLGNMEVKKSGLFSKFIKNRI
ncbi:MAG TPA: UDP-N-acetylmuramate dehydrogenase [Patescibacteria group bacterium]|nr:UDP-N-acetylmuramate dehydrogenase [Patescibacteria group bacterium]